MSDWSDRRATVSFPTFAFRDRPGRAAGGGGGPVAPGAGADRQASRSIASSRRPRAAASCRSIRSTSTATCGRPPGWSAPGPGSRWWSTTDSPIRWRRWWASSWSSTSRARSSSGTGRARISICPCPSPTAGPPRVVGGQTYARAGRHRRRRPQIGRDGARVRAARRRLHGRGRRPAVSTHRRHEGVQQRRRCPRLAAAAGGGAARSADLGGASRRPRPAAKRVRLRSVAGQ